MMEYLQMLLLLMPGKKIFFHILSEDIPGWIIEGLGGDLEGIGRESGGDREEIGRGSGGDQEKIGRGSVGDWEGVKMGLGGDRKVIGARWEAEWERNRSWMGADWGQIKSGPTYMKIMPNRNMYMPIQFVQKFSAESTCICMIFFYPNLYLGQIIDKNKSSLLMRTNK